MIKIIHMIKITKAEIAMPIIADINILNYQVFQIKSLVRVVLNFKIDNTINKVTMKGNSFSIKVTLKVISMIKVS